MEKKYKLSEQAKEDIEEIFIYTIKNWSEEQAENYVDLILDKIEFLSENQFIGASASNILVGLRKYRVKSHYIFYEIINENLIRVARIIHEKKDLEQAFNA